MTSHLARQKRMHATAPCGCAWPSPRHITPYEEIHIYLYRAPYEDTSYTETPCTTTIQKPNRAICHAQPLQVQWTDDSHHSYVSHCDSHNIAKN